MAPETRTRLMLLIGGSVVLSLLLVAASIALYFSSGTAQLDLSRPGYKSVRDQNKPDNQFKGFSSSGSITNDVLAEFEKMYRDRAKNAVSIDAFNPDVLSESALGLDDTTAPEE